MRGIETTQVMTKEDQFRVLLNLYPELSSLVEDLDLRDPFTGMRFPVDEPKVVSQTDTIKLRRIAERLLIMGRIYTAEQVITLIVGGLNVERQRAINGLRMMLSSGVLILQSGKGIRLS